MGQTEQIEWVPVSDHMPVRDDWYMVTNRHGGVHSMWFTDGDFEHDDCERAKPGFVVAWAKPPRGYDASKEAHNE